MAQQMYIILVLDVAKILISNNLSGKHACDL